jgi:hypothetical protein
MFFTESGLALLASLLFLALAKILLPPKPIAAAL